MLNDGVIIAAKCKIIQHIHTSYRTHTYQFKRATKCFGTDGTRQSFAIEARKVKLWDR